MRATGNKGGKSMLAGVRIIEIEALGPAPFAAMLLADLGADIITIHLELVAETPGKGADICSTVASDRLRLISKTRKTRKF